MQTKLNIEANKNQNSMNPNFAPNDKWEQDNCDQE